MKIPIIQDNNNNTALMMASENGHTDIVNLLERSMATIRIQKRFKTRRKHRKYRTHKAKQMSAFSKSMIDPDSTLTQNFRWNPNIIEDIGQHVKYYQNVMDRTRQEEQDEQDREQDEERMQLYTEWLQDRSQLGSGQRSKRRRNKSRRKYMY